MNSKPGINKKQNKKKNSKARVKEWGGGGGVEVRRTEPYLNLKSPRMRSKGGEKE